MSPYIRRYAKYLNEKALAYRTVAFDFCKVKRGYPTNSIDNRPPFAFPIRLLSRSSIP